MLKRYHHAALGGTFDRLHIGHEYLLKTAIEQAKRLTIGLTTESMTEYKVYAEEICPYDLREKELRAWLADNNAGSIVKILPLIDIYGTTLTDRTIDGIVVTEQTRPGADRINKARRDKGLKPLPVTVVRLVEDNEGDYISSTKIRRGLIDRRGRVYSHWFTDDVWLSDRQRDQIKEPQGELIHRVEEMVKVFEAGRQVVLVGDVITQFAVDNNLSFSLAIIDRRSGRRPFDFNPRNWRPKFIFPTENRGGGISWLAARVVMEALNYRDVLVEVEGEEDLLAFPAVLNLPLGSRLLYGQPQKGIVMMEITEKLKLQLCRFLDQKM